MQYLLDTIHPTYFNSPPPRKWSVGIVLNVISHALAERPYVLLDPVLILGIMVAMLTRFLDGPEWLALLGALVALVRLMLGLWKLWRRIHSELMLLRQGQLILAHVLKLRPYRTLAGEIHGALLDCAIPLSERRVYVGSVWFADANEALRLSQKRRVNVIALPLTPGTWRVIEPVSGEVRYDRTNPVLTLAEK